MQKWILTLICLCMHAAGRLQPVDLIRDSLDTYIRRGMEEWKVPGLGILIVKDGQTVVRKCYGWRNMEQRLPFDENTAFFIASNTKLFTGTVLSVLSYRGKLSLDDPMRKFFPDFTLYKPSHSAEVTLTDMLSHRIGTEEFQGDFTYWNSNLTRQQIMQKMRYMKPAMVFRQDFGYCNSCFLSAGEVAAKAGGVSWDRFVTDSIFMPLGMTNSTVFGNTAPKEFGANIAVPYTLTYDEKFVTVPYDRWENLGPAASIVSNLTDLEKWVRCQLDSGRVGAKEIIPWPAMKETRRIRTMISSTRQRQLPINFTGYGLGLFVGDYNGEQTYWHTGGAAGMVSNVCFVPGKNLGIVILTNSDAQGFFESLRHQILDHYLGVPYTDRSREDLPDFNGYKKEEYTRIAALNERVGKASPPLALGSYTGTYSNTQYGNVTLEKEGDHLRIRFGHHPGLIGYLHYMDKGDWRLTYNNETYGSFATKFGMADKRPVSLTLKAKDYVEYGTYEFRRK